MTTTVLLMKSNRRLFAAGMFLASVSLGLGQPVITTQPEDQRPILGATATFTVVATGTPPLTYQWRSYANPTSFTNIVDETNATLVLPNVQPTPRRFGVVVSNAGGSVTSDLARLTVLVPPAFLTQPTDQTVEAGSRVTFSLSITGTPPVSIQWRYEGTDLAGQSGTNLTLNDVQVSRSGSYAAVVANEAGAITSHVARLTVVPPLFTKVTTGPVGTSGGDSYGVAWGDYDGDGNVDLFVANYNQPSFLFHNDGNGTFSRVASSIVTLSARSAAPAWADYDNDGDLDLFVALGLGVTNSPGGLLFRNEGTGSFVRITNSNVATATNNGYGCSWADYNRDGLLDLFVVNNTAQGHRLYRNNGDGTFTALTTNDVGRIVEAHGQSFGSSWADYDNDGDPDLSVGNGFGGNENNSLYRNNGDGTFSSLTTNEVGSIVGDGGNSDPAAWGDYDNDGDLDAFVANYDNPSQTSRMYRNNGDGTFTRIEVGPPTEDHQFAQGCVSGDFDNDGWLDLFVANGQDPNGDQNNSLYRNNGDGTFSKITSTRLGSVVNDSSRSFGCGWADYDNDGFLDLFVANASAENDFLYHNNGNSNHWLNLKLVGTRSNRSAIGAKVRVKALIRGRELWQLREIASGSSYLSQQDLRAAFGLGDATNVDVVRIEWPSGLVQEMANVAANQFLTITESAAPPMPPVITHQPEDQMVIAGATATFSVAVTGTEPLSYQWRSHANSVSFTNIPGATGATLVMSNVQPTSQRFAVVVSSSAGAVTSVLARLIVLLPPSIVQHPLSQSSVIGDRVSNAVVATGTAPLGYQWRFNGADLLGQTSSNLVLVNVQLTNAGAYTVVVTNLGGAVTSQVAQVSIGPPAFTRITTGPVATDLGNATGPAWADYDGDGYLDLFVANRALRQNFLYRNNGNGTFTRITTNAIATENSGNIDSFGSAWADYDNDGDPDLFVVNCCLGNTNAVNDFFYRNNGGGTFTRVLAAPLATDFAANAAGAWADYDHDGNLDLTVTTGNEMNSMRALSLYRNTGSGTFSKVTTNEAGSIVGPTSGFHDAIAWGDYDNDGDPDLFAGGIFVSNVVHRNNGDGTFTRLTAGQVGSLALEGGAVGSCAWGDFNNDGFLDLFVGNYGRKNDLYRNNGNGSFTRVTDGIVVNDTPSHSYSCGWADYDNDGHLDLFVANGDPSSDTAERNFLYHNNGDGTFTKVTGGRVATDLAASFSCAWGDYDNDGFLDLFVGNGGWGNPRSQVSWLYHNAGNSNHWLKVRLIGAASNRDAIGAKVRVRAVIGGQTLWQLREIASGGGFGQSELRANFGLGDATNVELVRIEWPSGTVQEIANVVANRFLTLTEPPRLQALGLARDGSFQLRLSGGVGFRYDLERSSDLIGWSPWRMVTNTLRSITISDPDATTAAWRFYRAAGR